MKRHRKNYPRSAASGIKQREHMRRKRKAAKKRWKCQTCFRRPVPSGKTVCAICTRTKSRQEKRRMTERHAAGLCMRCGLVPATVRDRLCAGCEWKRTSAPSYGTNVTVERRQAENLCRDCGVESALDKSRCEGCRQTMADKQKQRAEDRIAAGRCYRCGKRPAPKREQRRACSVCRRKRQVRTDRRKTPPAKAHRPASRAPHTPQGSPPPQGGEGVRKTRKRVKRWNS